MFRKASKEERIVESPWPLKKQEKSRVGGRCEYTVPQAPDY